MNKDKFGVKVSKRAVEIAHLAKNGKKASRRRGKKTGKREGGGATTPDMPLFAKPPAPTVVLKSIKPLFPKD